MSDNYNKNRYGIIKLFYRMSLGIRQFLNYPFLNFIWIFIVVGTILLLNGKERFVDLLNPPPLLMPIINVCINFLVVFIPVIIFMSIIQGIGELTARKDEADLMFVFDKKELINAPPILIYKRTFKNGVTVREFYSKIAMSRWQEQKATIEDVLNVHFIRDIQYGGKSNGNRILIKTAKGRRAIDRGVLYDDTF